MGRPRGLGTVVVRGALLVALTGALAAPAAAAPPMREAVVGALGPGTYTVSRFAPEFFFEVGEGWKVVRDHPAAFELSVGKGTNLAILRIPLYVYQRRTGDPVRAPADMLRWLRSHPCVVGETKPVAVTVGGNPGMQFDFSIASRPGCTAAYWEVGDRLVYRFVAGERNRVILLRVTARGSTDELIVDVSTVAPRRFAAFLRQASSVLDTIGFL